MEEYPAEQNPTMRKFLQAMEAWIGDPSEDKDVTPLKRAALAHIRSGRCVESEFAPCLAAFWFSVIEFAGSSKFWDSIERFMIKAIVWIYEHNVYRDRPMWNDFRMTLWMLSRDEFYVCELHHHLMRARDKGIPQQFFTGQWMVKSVSEQDEDFRKAWEYFDQLDGPVYD